MLSCSKVSFWDGHFEEVCPPRRTPKFGQNCVTNNFLHCEFQLSTLSSSKVLF